jgi:hypothetical protein
MTGRVLGLRPAKSSAQSGAAASQSGIRLGKLLALAAPDGVWVELAPQAGRVLARLGIDCDAARLTQAIEQGQPAVLAFEDGECSRPIVLGIVSPFSPTAACPAPSVPTGLVVEADADGRRVRLEAQEEVVLQCGLSSITLQRNGRVVIRGSYVETYATGTNRIKGGNVRVN